MNLKEILIGGAAAVAITLSSAPALASITVGNADNGNCYPFSCGPTDGVTEYQEVYNKNAFSGPISFDTISFTMWPDENFGPMDSGTYAVSFYIAANPFPTLSSNLPLNEGALLGNFGTFNLNGPMPATLSLTGTTINYDPSLGDLLMDVGITNGISISGRYNVFFNADYTGTDVQRAFDGISGGGNVDGALQTTFGNVPEPATWAVLLIGFGAAGFIMRGAKRKGSGVVVVA
jgi:hypothetical protein